VKTLSTFAVIAFAVCAVGNPKHAAAQWPEATSHEPTVTIEFGGIAFDREGDSDSPLSISDTVTNVNTLTNEQASDLGSGAGVQGKVIFPSRRTLQTFELRGSYTGWDEEAVATGDNIGSPFLIPGLLQIEDLIDADITEEPLSTILPIGVLQSDLELFTIPLTTAFDGDVSTLSLVWPFLPDDILAEGISAPTLENIFDVQSLTTRYTSDYTSIELMSRRNTNPGVTWLFGPRFVSVREELQITAAGTSPVRIFQTPGVFFTDVFGNPVIPVPPGDITVDGDGFADPDGNPVTVDGLPLDDDGNLQAFPVNSFGTEESTLATRTESRNSMIGLQIGLEYNLPITQDIYFQMTGRTGLFANTASVTRSASPLRQASSFNANEFVTRDENSDTGEAWLAEFSVRGYVDVVPNRVSCYAGYDLLFIDEIALAPDQVVSPDVVDTSGELFARGLTFGVKMNY
jgi:hypothetical protein